MSIQDTAAIRADGAAEVSVTGAGQGGLGELLRSYRQSAALTQEELAHLAQLSPRAIWDLERGRSQRPRRSAVDGLINALPLDNGQARLLAAAARDPGTGMRAAISRSYRALAPEPARLFRRLGLHPGPLARAVGTGTTEARRLLDQLTSAHLLEESGHGCYEFHDLLRLYAAEQASTEHLGGDRAATASAAPARGSRL